MLNHCIHSITSCFHRLAKERVRSLILLLLFSIIIFSYTMIRDIKDGVFGFIVGAEFVSHAKLFSTVVFIPLFLFYSFIVDRIKFYYLLAATSLIYGVIGIFFAFLAGSTCGVEESRESMRWLWWVFYYFGEAFSPLLVSGFWAFANMISPPESAKKNYGLFVICSKLAGMLSAFSAIQFLRQSTWSDCANARCLILVASSALFLIPLLTYILLKTVPKECLRGYDATYRLEMEKKEEKKSVLAGLKYLLANPYVLGMFSLVFFYESITTVMSVMRVGVAKEASVDFSSFLINLYQTYLKMHCIGFFIAIFGTQFLLKAIGPKRCLILVPLIDACAVTYYLIHSQGDNKASAFEFAYLTLKSVNYSFSMPVRECLYIPTTKEIRLKSKAWIDAFGGKIGKTTGAGFRTITQSFPVTDLIAKSSFFGSLFACWFVSALFLGIAFSDAITRNRVIGSDPEDEENAPLLSTT